MSQRYLSRRCAYILIASAALTGCKTSIETQVMLSDLLGTEPLLLRSNLFVEVPSCNSYEDSRKPSDSLIEAQQEIPTVFRDAEYVECFSQRLDSFAHFEIDVAVNRNADTLIPDRINLISNSELLLVLGIPDAMRNSINRMRADSLSTFDLEMTIEIQNDTGEFFDYRAFSVYVNDVPNVYRPWRSNPEKDSFFIRLSSVTIETALELSTAQVLAFSYEYFADSEN